MCKDVDDVGGGGGGGGSVIEYINSVLVLNSSKVQDYFFKALFIYHLSSKSNLVWFYKVKELYYTFCLTPIHFKNKIFIQINS